METPNAVSNFFIQKSLDTGIEVSPMKLIKLVYLSHGWHLGIWEEPLIDEAVQAWKYGPVIVSVYHKFKPYGTEAIDKLTSQFVVSGLGLKTFIPNVDKENHNMITLLNKVWDVYKDFTAMQLSTITHEKNSPWDIIWNKEGGIGKKSAIIPNELIRDYYKKRAAANSAP